MEENQQEKVPLFKTWKSWYILIVAFLLVLILLFSVFTKTFS